LVTVRSHGVEQRQAANLVPDLLTGDAAGLGGRDQGEFVCDLESSAVADPARDQTAANHGATLIHRRPARLVLAGLGRVLGEQGVQRRGVEWSPCV
jgi:hypothetical protein